MECSRAEIYISRLADNELEKDKTEELLSHISGCENCRKLKNEIVSLTNKLSILPDAKPSPFLVKKILSRINSKSKLNLKNQSISFFKWWKISPPKMRTAAVSFAVMGLLIGLVFGLWSMDEKLKYERSSYYMAINDDNGGLY